MGELCGTVILVYAPAEPGVPFVVTPSVYSDPPPCDPLLVVENLSGWLELELSDWSKVYVAPRVNVGLGLSTPSK